MPQAAAGGASAGPVAIARKAIEEAKRLKLDTGAFTSIHTLSYLMRCAP